MSKSQKLSLSDTAARSSEQAISFLMQQGLENPDCIALAAGFVDQSTLPTNLVRDAVTALMSDPATGRAALQYGTTPGSESLRRVFREHLCRLEGRSDALDHLAPDQFVLSTGSQQMLSLVVRALFNPGDVCLVARPTYFVMLSVLEGAGVEAVPVETDEDGIRPEAAAQVLKELVAQGKSDRVKAVYCVSYYDNPSCWSLSEERRRRLLEVVEQYSQEHSPLLILEDAAYREIRFDGPVLPSILSMDRSGQRVVYTQTFSKSFSPGIRVGMSVLPSELARAVCNLKGNDDFGSPHLSQQIVAWALRNGRYSDHVDKVVAGYRTKRDIMLEACRREFAEIDGVSWVHPHGGMYVWLSLPEGIRTGFDSDLFRCASKVHKVMYVPGELAYPATWPERPQNEMRLSFGLVGEDELREGIRRLAAAVRDTLAAH